MSVVKLNNGIFEQVGESVTLKLFPITQATEFTSFSDSTDTETAEMYFKKEFRYKKNFESAYTPFILLTNENLSKIDADPIDVFYFEFKYTRQGTKTDGLLKWKCFHLEAIKIDACIIIKINKNSYDNKYGESKFIQIIQKLAEFNKEMTEKGLQNIFPVIDNTITDKDGRDMVIIKNDCARDMNEILKSLFGNQLTNDLFEIRIDTFDGIRE